jgi:dTDP-4-amino-4,6-dideoxygalactose transaminase
LDTTEKPRVAFLDVGAAHRELDAELEAAFRRVMASGWYILGAEVEAFEREWAAASDARDCVGVGSGLDALILALRALGVGPGDEVLVPSNTYIATWLAVSAVGATPVPVEPDPSSYVVEPAAMRAAIGPRTAALLPVHLYGLPVDAAAMEELADDEGVALLFDAAQAHGARSGGKPVGAFGHASAWSFYPTKNLGALGDGGAVTTNDEALARRIRRLRNYGSETRYHNLERGVNSRLDELQAAFLRVKAAKLGAWNELRAAHAARYRDALRGSNVVTPRPFTGRESSWHLYVIQTAARDQLRGALANQGIETLIHYPVPPHLQPAYRDLGIARGQLPVAEELAARVLSLPCGPHLSPADQARVIEALTEAAAPSARGSR